jgi:hypothetical protein
MNTSSSSEDDDPLREARAYNQSIYLMVAMPYVLFGALGFMVYRGIKTAQKNAQARLLDAISEELDTRIDDREWTSSGPGSTTE